MAGPAPVEAPPPPPEAPEAPWFEELSVDAFVDGYFAINTNFPKPQAGTSEFRAFDQNNGFALSWAGLNIGYAADPVGATVDLRFGPSAEVLARGRRASADDGGDTEFGLEFVKQAYGTWRPGGEGSPFVLDFGKFDSIYGAEVADSQYNMNYTRGLLYTLARPYFLTGLRGSYAFTDQVSATALVVNGWDRSIDNNAGKSFGLQLSVMLPNAGEDLFAAHLGYLVGPEQVDFYEAACEEGTYDPRTNTCAVENNGSPTFPVDRGNANTEGLRHLIDLVLTLEPTDALVFTLNGDLAFERAYRDEVTRRVFRTVSWYGVALGARYQIDDVFAVAGRGEYFGDPDAYRCGAPCAELGHESLSLLSGTLTGEAAPTRHLILRLDARIDGALEGREVFPIIRTREPTQFTATFGVVATTE